MIYISVNVERQNGVKYTAQRILPQRITDFLLYYKFGHFAEFQWSTSFHVYRHPTRSNRNVKIVGIKVFLELTNC